MSETEAIFKMVVVFGILVTLALAPVKKTAGGVAALLVTSTVLIFGLWVYSQPGFTVVFFDSRIPKGVFFLLVAVWYGFDVNMIVRGLMAVAAARKIEAAGETDSEWQQLTIKDSRGSRGGVVVFPPGGGKVVPRTEIGCTITLERDEATVRGPDGEILMRVPRGDAQSAVFCGGLSALLAGNNLEVAVSKTTAAFLLSEIDLAYVRRWVRLSIATEASRSCLQCGAQYLDSDYRASAPEWHCRSCRALLPRV